MKMREVNIFLKPYLANVENMVSSE